MVPSAAFARIALLLLLVSVPLLPTPARAQLPAAVDGQPLPSLAPMLKQVTPAVVNIQSRSVVRVRDPLMDDPFFRRFFGLPGTPRERVRQSLGSGVVVDAERGLVLTNNHVIEGADDISVTLADGRVLEAEYVGSDEDTDVALVRIPADDLSAIRLADTDAIQVGDFVVAVGNPFGLGQTVTSGIVSALGRSGLSGLGYQNFIQTDASINPGNSGGALVNLRGELIGINTAIFNPSGSRGGNIGIGFAIPANLARRVMQQLLTFGEVRRGSLGVEAQDLDAALAETLGIMDRRGALVTRVFENTPAATAGLRAGDVITAIDTQPILDRDALHNAEGLLPVDRDAQLTLTRDGREITLPVRLTTDSGRYAGGSLDARLAGASFSELPEKWRQQGATGVRIATVKDNSRAAALGLQPDDLLVAINRRPLDGLADLRRLGGRLPEQALLSIQRGRRVLPLLLQ
ncbi:MAG: Do family serine endopeptidase [Xanthomonadales bacterium]|nr:Do family serine endopeptidase [Xanthomonadales bacterium]